MQRQSASPSQMLRTYLRPQRMRVALLSLVIVTAIGIQLINPQVLRVFLDGAESQRPLAELTNLAFLFIGLALLRQLLKIASAYISEIVAWTATNALRADLVIHCLNLDMRFHKEHKPGELIERVDGDINQLATFFSRLIIQLLANLLLCAGVILLLIQIDWTIGLVVFLIFAIGFVVIRQFNKIAIPRIEAEREVNASLFGYIEEWLHGTETIRSNSAEPYIMHKLYRLLRDRWQRSHHAMKTTTAIISVPNTVFSLAYITVFTIGSWHYFEGQLSIGTVFSIFFYIDILRDPLWGLSRQIDQLQRAQASINRIQSLFLQTSTVIDKPQPHPLPTASNGLQIDVDQLSFAYADEPDKLILDKLTFTLRPGQVLGLLGRTGSGKSTLTKMLLRFYDPTAGSIRLGDGQTQVDLRDLSQKEIRKQIGAVTQQVQLFHASVRDNLTFFDDTIGDEAIVAALEEVGLTAWLAALPDGLDSYISAETTLSAGEAQLLAFTRVFLTDPKLVILDEASSRLDPATESRIEQALSKLRQNRTVIIIAHHLATVDHADEIMILSHGQILEYAARATLIADPDSHFNKLLQTGITEAAS